MPRDAAGVPRAGAFTTQHDPESGLTFTPLGGTATRIRYRVSGPGAAPGATVTAPTAYLSARSLAYAAYEQGAATPPASDALHSLAYRHG